jgi:hypothetical protein
MHRILFAALCFVVGCSGGASTPRVATSNWSPDKKHLAELVEMPVQSIVGDYHFEIRITSPSTNGSATETVYKSPDEGGYPPRLLWSDDGRYLLAVGKGLGVVPDAGTDKGEMIYLLYDSQSHEVRCNSTQLNIPLKSFDFRDLAGINFGEAFRPERQN